MPAPRDRLVVSQLETLRVLAMLWIFVYHLWSEAPAAVRALPLGELLEPVCRHGYLGVMLFNAVTGFVLALPHVGAEARPLPACGEFLRKRFWRICPPYYLALTGWTLAALLCWAGDKGLLWPAFLLHLGFVHGFSQTYFFSIVPAYWWLGLLAQFYLLFPWIMRLFRRLGPGRALLASLVGCWGAWELLALAVEAWPDAGLGRVSQMWLFHLPARLPEFAFGIWLASRWRARRESRRADGPDRPFALSGWETSVLWLAGLCGVLALGALVRPRTMPLEHFFLTTASLLGLLGLFVHPWTERLGRTPLVARVAAASYGLYLMHQPILHYLAKRLGPNLDPAALGWTLLLVGGILSWGGALALDRAAARLGRIGVAPRPSAS